MIVLSHQGRPRRRPSLTPMIDVVFLLLVFFMLAARFGIEGGVPLMGAGSGAAEYSGPPRLVTVHGDGSYRLNGREVTDIVSELSPLLQSAEDLVLIRPQDSASVQHMVDLLEALDRTGLGRPVILEARE